MRYVLAAALLLCACTRANPDAIGGNGGSGGAGGGAAGSGGGAGGGTGGTGGGGNGGDHDMAMSTGDLATSPADMTSFTGVFCGDKICTAPDGECCAMQSSLVCQSPMMQCNGAPYDCDGPEDCLKNETCCGGGTGSTCNQLNGGSCQGGRVPLCHTLDDCPKSSSSTGFVACCPSPQGGHIHFCSKTAC